MKHKSIHRPIIAISGLAFEARLARCEGIYPIFGQNKQRLIAELEAAIDAGARGIISFGTAGGLAPSFRPGSIVVASSIQYGSRNYPTDSAWTRRLLKSLPSSRHAGLVSVEAPVMTALDKAILREETGAGIVDMESYIVAEAGERFGIPFTALRVVIDPAQRSIPPLALIGMKPDGGTDAMAIMKALRKEPQQLKALMRLAQDARAARKALFRSRKVLGPFLGLLDPREFAFDME